MKRSDYTIRHFREPHFNFVICGVNDHLLFPEEERFSHKKKEELKFLAKEIYSAFPECFSSSKAILKPHGPGSTKILSIRLDKSEKYAENSQKIDAFLKRKGYFFYTFAFK